MTELELFVKLKKKLEHDINTAPITRIGHYQKLLDKVEEKLQLLKQENKP